MKLVACNYSTVHISSCSVSQRLLSDALVALRLALRLRERVASFARAGKPGPGLGFGALQSFAEFAWAC